MSPESGKFSIKHSEAAKKGWQMDEDKKTARVAAIHNETWTKRIRESWDTLSAEERAKRSSGLSEVGREALRKAYRARVIACLGEDPKQTLKDFIKNGLSIPEMAVQLKETTKVPTATRTICFWLKKEGVQTNKTTSLNHQTIQDRQKLITLGRERNLIQCLRPGDLLVINIRYDDNGRITKLDEIGRQVGNITKQAVKQREKRGFSDLEKMLNDTALQ